MRERGSEGVSTLPCVVSQEFEEKGKETRPDKTRGEVGYPVPLF